MAIPTPEPGLVISYAYVWDHEAQSGQEEGRKDRPCVITLAVERNQDEETVVTVLPVTHRPPDDATAVVEIPPAIKKHLGLDDQRSWVVVSEGDQFVWPGYDLRQGAEHRSLRLRLFAAALLQGGSGGVLGVAQGAQGDGDASINPLASPLIEARLSRPSRSGAAERRMALSLSRACRSPRPGA